jgi:diaminopimelate epimerase
MILKFYKYHGTGNDFIVVDLIKYGKNILTKKQIVKLCKRNFGIGADGILLVLPSEKADYKMRIFNPDGTEPEMCGNGIRCFVKYLADNSLLENKKSVNVETLAGIKKSKFYAKNGKFFVEVNMGKADFEDLNLFKGSYIEKDISKNEKFTAVSVGNPHMVIIKDKKVEKDYLLKRGKELVYNEYYNAGTNVEFINIKSSNEIDMMVYERGAGITLACGTGACASVSVLGKLKKINFNEWIKLIY